MLDIHSHILPMVDDGASSVEMALEMLDKAYRDGTDAIVLTPHFAYDYDFVNPYKKIRELFEDFKHIVEDVQIPIELYLGCEYLFTDKESFKKHLYDITTINNTKYLLIEFFFNVSEEDILEAIDTLLKHKLIPIIAHPERFDVIQESETLIEEIVKKGALLQLNKGSILGRYGNRVRDTALYLMDHHYISFVGSDAHHPLRRSSLMYEAYIFIKEYYGKEYTEKIFIYNPKKMLKGIDIRKI